MGLIIAVATAGIAQGEAGGPTITLASGDVAGQHWQVSLSRTGGVEGEDPRGRLLPCLSIGVHGPPEEVPLPQPVSTGGGICMLSPILKPSGAPLMAEQRESTVRRSIESRMTAVGIIFAPGVTKVALTNFNGARRTLRVRRLSPGQAQETGLARLGYLAFAVQGPYCADRIVSYGRRGAKLYDSRAGRCPEEEFPVADGE